MTTQYCEHCGASLKKYWHRLTPILVDALIKFRRAVVEKGENKIHLIRDLQGTHNELKPYEWKNWTKVRFHGLAAKYKENGEWVRGFWLLTRRGADFLNGKISIPAKVATYRNKVVERSEEEVNLKDVVGSSLYVESVNDISFESPTEDEKNIVTLAIRKKIKKTKGKSYCPECGNQLKLKLITEEKEQTIKVIGKDLVCPIGHYREPFIPFI